MEIAIAIGLLVLVVVAYVLSYAWNQNTEIPEGCKDLTDFSGCGGCVNSNCSIKKKVDSIDTKHDS